MKPPAPNRRHSTQWTSACFLRACVLDVLVRKPGNVSLASAGHRMHAGLFISSARAAVGPLCAVGSRVGQRIQASVAASWAAVACNTNLGILLLCAPVARAVQLRPGATTPLSLRAAVEAALAGLDLSDAVAAYRAIALARPGGLGQASSHDVRDPPSLDLRAAMALAAPRDRIARQYRDGYADLFDLALPALGRGFSPMSAVQGGATGADEPGLGAGSVNEESVRAVQRLYLTLLSAFPDSHIVRNHGEAVAHSVMAAAQTWLLRLQRGDTLDGDADFAAWDLSLKARRINPGTTADLCVAALLLADLMHRA